MHVGSSGHTPRSFASRFAITLLAVGLGAAGCSSSSSNTGSASGQASGAGNLTTITVEAQPNGASLPLVVAQNQGLFKAVGLDVKIKYYATGPAAMAAGPNGEWQAGWIGAPPALTSMASFGLIPVGLMIQEDENHIMFMTKKVLEGSTPADVLKTQPVATVVNSLGEQVMAACAKHLGVDPTTVKVVNLDPGAVVQAIKSGQVQVANAWAPPSFPLLNDPNYVKVCDGKQSGVHVVDPFVVTPKFATDNPRAAAQYTAAVYAANKFINDNHDKSVQAMLDLYKANGINGSKELAEYEVSIRQWVELDDAVKGMEDGSTAAALKASAQFFINKGVYTDMPPVDAQVQKGLAIIKEAQTIKVPTSSS